MKTLAFLILAVFGGVALYDESPEFRQSVDNLVAEIEADHPNFATHYANHEMESVAFDRADAFRTTSSAKASSYAKPYAGGARYAPSNPGNLSDRYNSMQASYRQVESTMRNNNSYDRPTTQAVNNYYGARYNYDQGRSNYRQGR